MGKKLRYREINFDETVPDRDYPELGVKEMPVKDNIFYKVLFAAVIVSIAVVGRVIYLGGVEYDYYRNRALANINQEISIIAPRGIITDRYGMPLVENRPIFSVFLRSDLMISNNEEDEVIQAVEGILQIKRDDILKKIRGVDLENEPDIVIARDINRDQTIAIKSLNLQSLQVEDDYKRHYIGEDYSHIIGYVGQDGKDNLVKGIAGLEAYYDNFLKGNDGKKIIYKNAKGEVQSIEKVKDPQIGEELKTTIDSKFQKYFYNRMKQGLDSLGRTNGVGIAINPSNGEILALASFPSFDANNIVPYLNKSNQPLFNRAVSGLYNPGSTIKPMHAAAVLKEGVVNSSYQIYSPGYIEIPNPYNPDKPSRFLDWRPQGWVDVYSALARSSNVYFYETVGGFQGLKGLGIEKLTEYWKKFNFDKKTGIDLPNESSGFLPSPEEKEKRTGMPWRVGDTYNISIGQGDISITPLELLSAISAVSNGGKGFVPHLKLGENSRLNFDISDLAPELKEVRKGMEDAVYKSYGTAYSISDLPFKIAAKTGSAQTNNNTKTNAMFVGYTPVQDPQIAILILVENAKEGSLNTLPIARDVLRWYYDNRIQK
jgi:penicillin-binding protein 2